MIVAIIAAFYLVYGGIQYLTTDMSSTKLEGKETIKRVLVGLIFIFSVWTIFNAINPQFLKSNITFSKTPQIDKSVKGGVSNVSRSTSASGTPVATVNNGNYPWPTGNVVGNGVTCNGGSKKRSISTTACSDNYKSYIEQASSKYGVDKNIIRAVIWQESQGNINAVSNHGAIGLMQILPSTASSIGCQSGWQNDAAKNIDCGTKYLKQGQNKGYSNYDLYAGYNGGYGNNSMNPSSNCNGLKRWQCSFDDNDHKVCNTGFVESRNYAIEGSTWQSTLASGSMCSW